MLVLDRSRALESMLWLSQRVRNAVPPPYQRPSSLAGITTPEGGRRLAAALVLRPAVAVAEAESLLMPLLAAPHP
jgi:hypothetical protein